MDFDGLALNLLSEGIGIAATVFGVDRLIGFRERRKWSQVNEFFWSSVHDECRQINEAFAHWLAAISAYAIKPRGKSLPELFDDFSDFAGTVTQTRDVERFSAKVVNHLGETITRSDVRESDCWDRLGQEINGPLQRIEQLLETQGALLEPHLAYVLLVLNRDLDYLKRGGELQYAVRDSDAMEQWSKHLDRSMGRSIRSVLMLNVEIRKQRHNC